MAAPEAKARERIDRQLAAAGWVVQDYLSLNLSAGLGIAVREFPLASGAADYLLYADARVIGVVEAKPEGHTLTGVETQSAKYMNGLAPGIPSWAAPGQPIPFAYESTGVVTQFTNGLDPQPRSREVFSFHRPEELIRLAGLEHQLRAALRQVASMSPCHRSRCRPTSMLRAARLPTTVHPPISPAGSAGASTLPQAGAERFAERLSDS